MVFRAFVLCMFIAFHVVQEKRVKDKKKKCSENKASGNCYMILGYKGLLGEGTNEYFASFRDFVLYIQLC